MATMTDDSSITGDARDPNQPPRPGKPETPTHRRDGRDDLAPGLYLVATPIGNARDITLRALDVLAGADVIACEDTRVTAKLLALHGITTSTLSYHDHNAQKVLPRLIERLQNGDRVAQVSDAGMPTISDPGFRLVNACREAGHPVTVVPGASSVTTALALSGLATDRFTFAGFIPNKGGERRRWLSDLLAPGNTVVTFENAQRLPASLAALADIDPTRPVAVCREMTKRFEEARRDTARVLADHYADAGAPKGEVVVVIGPRDKGAETVTPEMIDAALADALQSLSVRDAARAVAEDLGVSRKAVYARALELTANDPR